MTRLTMWILVAAAGSSCGTLLNVGDESNNQNLNGARACGPTTCAVGEECCNLSCGICVQPGQGCTKQLCLTPPPRDAGQCSPVSCTLACQYGFQRGADGCEICACNPPPAPVQCGPNTCAVGEQCCNESCGICVQPGQGCTKQLCAPVDAGQPKLDAGSPTACGFNTCAPGTECCNASCGICTPPGFACTQQVCSCNPVACTLACQYGFKRGTDGCEICDCAPAPVTCGTVTCGAGLECCNASCGICVPPGNACTQQVCN